MVQASNFAHWCAGLGRYAARPRVSSRPSRVRTALCVAAPRVATASRTPQSIECPHRVVKRVMPAPTGLMRPARSSTTTSCPVAAQVDRSAQSSDPAPDDDRTHESDPNPMHRATRVVVLNPVRSCRRGASGRVLGPQAAHSGRPRRCRRNRVDRRQAIRGRLGTRRSRVRYSPLRSTCEALSRDR
jgi:hypothetical protein